MIRMDIDIRKTLIVLTLLFSCVAVQAQLNIASNNTTEERSIFNNNYVQVFQNGYGNIVLLFQNEDEKVFAIGERMYEINEEAYMNGYNWDSFFNYYLAKNAPDILEGMETDPEAGSYTAYFKYTEENEQKAKRFADIIISLIENEEEIYKLLRENGDEIEWN